MSDETKLLEPASTASGFPESLVRSESSNLGRQRAVVSAEDRFGVEHAAARNAVSTSVPSRLRSRRKRVALALKDWERVPSYLRDNE